QTRPERPRTPAKPHRHQNSPPTPITFCCAKIHPEVPSTTSRPNANESFTDSFSNSTAPTSRDSSPNPNPSVGTSKPATPPSSVSKDATAKKSKPQNAPWSWPKLNK